MADSGTYDLATIQRRQKVAEQMLAESSKPPKIEHWAQGLAHLGNIGADSFNLGRLDKQASEARKQDMAALMGILGGGATASPGAVAPSEAPAPASPAPEGGGALPRGIRNNNPLNIEAGPFTAGQPGFAGSDGRFAKFEAPEQGMGAASKLLDTYQSKHGLNTVRGIINRWAPSAEAGNNTSGYVASVAARLGIDPDQPLGPEHRQPLIQAMGQFENGRPISPRAATAQAMGFNGVPERPDKQGVYGPDATLIPEQPSQPAPYQVAQAGGGPVPAPSGPGAVAAAMTPQAKPASPGGILANVPANQRAAVVTGMSASPGSPAHTVAMSILSNAVKSTDRTDDIKEYDFATKQGFKGTLEEWLQRKRGGAGEYGMQPIWGVDKDGNPAVMQLGKGGTAIQSKTPEGFKIAKDPIKIETGTGTILLDPQTRTQIGFVPKDVAGAAKQKEVGEAEGQALVNLPTAIATAENTLKTIEQLKNHPGKKNWGAFGWGAMIPDAPGGATRGFGALVDQVKGQNFMTAFQSLKGAGAITEQEGAKAEKAQARLDRAQNEKDFDTALDDLISVVKSGMERARGKAGVKPAGAGAPPPAAVPDPLGIR